MQVLLDKFSYLFNHSKYSLKTSDGQAYTEPQKKSTSILQKDREDMLRAVLEDIEDVEFDNLESTDFDEVLNRRGDVYD